MRPFTSTEIETASSALANQLAAGINIREAVGRMARLQPTRADLWSEAAEALSRGGRLSTQLDTVWPEGLIAALKAGEESGKLEDVMRRITAAMQVKAQVKKIWSKLTSPAIAFGAGLAVALFFMTAVIPKLSSTMGGGEQSMMIKISGVVSNVVLNYWPLVLLVIGGTVLMVVQWLRTPGNVDRVIAFADKRPLIGDALRTLYFGMWAYQMALLDAAGLPAKQQLILSSRTLPECYREGVLLMAEEVEKRGIADSADPDKQVEGDPRRDWPFYIGTAFITAHETGRIDQEMERCAPILIDDGLKKLTRVASVADLIAKVAAAQMIAAPLLGYFMQMSASLSHAFQ